MSPVFITGLVLSAAIGLSLGLIGGGGSILTVPILVYFFEVSPHDAVGMSLAVVGATSLIGSYLHYRRDNVDIYGGLLFGGAGTVGAFFWRMPDSTGYTISPEARRPGSQPAWRRRPRRISVQVRGNISI